MKVLIITGKLAESTVRKAASDSDHEVHVHVVEIPIAAFLTPRRIISEISKMNFSESDKPDIIIIPGLIPKDARIINDETGIPAYKGPTDAADLPIVLEILEKLKLSTKKPADKLIEEEQRKRALKFIEDFEKDVERRKRLLERDENILVGGLPVGRDFPMRVLAEVANAPFLSEEKLKARIEYFIRSGADMIDLGMIAGEDNSDMIPEIIETARSAAGNTPVSIDSLNPSEIEVAAECGADMILSLDHGNYREVMGVLKKNSVPAVILPTDYSEGWVPETPEERVGSLEELRRKCHGLDVIADPVLDPVNSRSIVESIIACRNYAERNPEPVFFGIGNVTELLDTDSTGVNALLAGIGMELGVSVLFTPEESGKTRGSVYELSVASKMMFLAENRGSVPKDLGINLVLFKDKRPVRGIKEDINVPVIMAEGGMKFVRDRKGSFKITVEDGMIRAVLYDKMEPVVTITSDSAKKIYEEIINRNLVSRMEHAAYLGAELQKAEIALKTGKGYVQDFELFRKLFPM